MAVVSVEAARHVTQPPPRYAEAGLVRRLDELGIGRPSTWTAVLAVLREREYAVLRDRHLAPSEQGRVVTAFLESAFGRWVDYGFTAAMETDLDRIAAGALAWRGMLEGFWAGFRPALDEAGALKRGAVREAVEERLAGDDEGDENGAGPRDLGADPDTGEALSLRRGPHRLVRAARRGRGEGQGQGKTGAHVAAAGA